MPASFRLRLGAAALIVGLLAGCVTINIYFPAAAAEKAADKIIDQVWQLQSPPASPAPPNQ
ncbi:MAG TPA: hypothetical protein VLW45_01850 [Pelomicrobium sp.]|nr:hypothetical protein [Pelomicrobium sp.]